MSNDQKSFLLVPRLWVGRCLEPILDYNFENRRQTVYAL